MADQKKKELTAEHFQIETVDNARAVITFGSQKSVPLTQADLHRIGKEIARAIQSTY